MKEICFQECLALIIGSKYLKQQKLIAQIAL